MIESLMMSLQITDYEEFENLVWDVKMMMEPEDHYDDYYGDMWEPTYDDIQQLFLD